MIGLVLAFIGGAWLGMVFMAIMAAGKIDDLLSGRESS